MVSTLSRSRLLCAALDQIIGIALGRPLVGTRAGQPALGGDQKPVIGIKRFADQIFRNLRAIGVGGVDEIHAQFRQRACKVASASALSFGGPQTPVAGDAHGAEAQAMNFRLAADRESYLILPR